MSGEGRCANCGSLLNVGRRDCVNHHLVCANCWNDHRPQLVRCPACDAMLRYEETER